MMQWKQVLRGSCVAGCLAVPAAAQTQSACRAERGVDLAIDLEPPDTKLREQLRRRMAAEFQVRDIEVCEPVAGQRRLAQVRVQSSLPELSPTVVRIQGGGGTSLQRDLELTALPPQARPSAIASAADELLSAVLETAATAGVADAAPQADATASAAPPRTQPALWKLPLLELGLGGGAARFTSHGSAHAAELLLRWRPLARASATLRVGGAQGLTNDPLGVHAQDHGWYAGLDGGIELIEPAEGFGLALQAGLAVARLRRSEEIALPTPVGQGLRLAPVGSSWEVAATPGAELSFRRGPFGVGLGLAALVPLTPNRSSPPDSGSYADPDGSAYAVISTSYAKPPDFGFGEKFGGELTLRFWVALGSSG